MIWPILFWLSDPGHKSGIRTGAFCRILWEYNQLTHLRETETWDCSATESAWLLQTPLTFNPSHRQAKPFISLWKSATAVSVIYTTSLPEDSRNKEQLIDPTAKYNCVTALWHPAGEWESYPVLQQGSMPTIQHITINISTNTVF